MNWEKQQREAEEILAKHEKDRSEKNKHALTEIEKSVAYEKLKKEFSAHDAEVFIDIKKYSWQEVNQFTPWWTKIIFFILFLGAVGLVITLSLWFIGLILILAGTGMVWFGFRRFLYRVKNTIKNDYCKFLNWYEEKRFKIKTKKKEIAYPEEWAEEVLYTEEEK